MCYILSLISLKLKPALFHAEIEQSLSAFLNKCITVYNMFIVYVDF